MPETATSDVMQQFNKALQTGDVTAITDLVAEDCVIDAPDGTRYEGKDSCVGFWQEFATMPGGTFEVDEVLIAHDYAVVRWRYRIGDDGAFATRGISLTHTRDGQIVSVEGFAKVD